VYPSEATINIIATGVIAAAATLTQRWRSDLFSVAKGDIKLEGKNSTTAEIGPLWDISQERQQNSQNFTVILSLGCGS
jgi:hypothetical protein